MDDIIVTGNDAYFNKDVYIYGRLYYDGDILQGTSDTISGSITIQDESNVVGTAITTINFIGEYITATSPAAGIVSITSSSGITIKDESNVVGTAITTINFIGESITATSPTAGIVSITVSAASTFDGPISLDVEPFFRNVPTITMNRTITTAYNEMSIGPITINSGVTVTVNSGATWTVI